MFPLPEPPPHYAEIALRGMSTMVPALQAYAGKPARPYVDGGYYMRTRENRPLIGPLPVEGAYVSCGFSGFGVMASCASGELIARHITGARAARLRAAPSCCRATRTRITAPCSTAGATAGSSDP